MRRCILKCVELILRGRTKTLFSQHLDHFYRWRGGVILKSSRDVLEAETIASEIQNSWRTAMLWVTEPVGTVAAHRCSWHLHVEPAGRSSAARKDVIMRCKFHPSWWRRRIQGLHDHCHVTAPLACCIWHLHQIRAQVTRLHPEEQRLGSGCKLSACLKWFVSRDRFVRTIDWDNYSGIDALAQNIFLRCFGKSLTQSLSMSKIRERKSIFTVSCDSSQSLSSSTGWNPQRSSSRGCCSRKHTQDVQTAEGRRLASIVHP